jgi:hypothetical protein
MIGSVCHLVRYVLLWLFLVVSVIHVQDFGASKYVSKL